MNVTPWEALERALDYFEDREDVVDGDYGVPLSNEAMSIAQMLRWALESKPKETK